MPNHNRLLALGRLTLACAGVVLTVSAIPALAGAASTPPPPTPVSFTDCGGTVANDKAGAAAGEPNLLDYKFRCNGNITAYTIIVDQQGDRGGSIDDYNPSPLVLNADGITPNPTEALTCEGTTPSDGINCNAGAGGALGAFNFASGSIDPIQAYCKHLPVAAPSKSTKHKATPAKLTTEAVPQAVVQLVVTDATGAEDGPFALGPAKPCPKLTNKGSTKNKHKHAGSRR